MDGDSKIIKFSKLITKRWTRWKESQPQDVLDLTTCKESYYQCYFSLENLGHSDDGNLLKVQIYCRLPPLLVQLRIHISSIEILSKSNLFSSLVFKLLWYWWQMTLFFHVLVMFSTPWSKSFNSFFKKGGVPRMGMGANPKECNPSNPWR